MGANILKLMQVLKLILKKLIFFKNMWKNYSNYFSIPFNFDLLTFETKINVT